MNSCIFCKIANKEIKSYILYEDSFSVAFLDINPISEGHTLFIPKKHYTRLTEIPENERELFFKSFINFLKVFEEKVSKDYNIINNCGKIAQQEIEHLHIHIIPRYGKEKVFYWETHKLTEEEAAKIVKKFL
ncbi:MAG: HIT family protein [Nanopusillaceae archaeon]